MKTLRELTEQFLAEEIVLRQGGGQEGKKRQQKHGRLTVRKRLEKLLDNPDEFFEIGLWSGYEMYKEWGGLPAAGVVTGIGKIHGHPCMVIANDATVKAGAMFPQSIKKFLRAQRIAYQCRLPIIYLVDSSGVFLPLQDEIFPDEDDFGRIFRNNSVLSACGIPQYAAIMGNCIAGGGYLPVLCDQLLMTEGSGLYLAGPALVKAAIGQEVDTEELGGAKMHSEISGTVDYRLPDDTSCIEKLRELIDMLPMEEKKLANSSTEGKPGDIFDLVSADNTKEYEVRDLLRCIVDAGSMDEYKSEYGKTVVTVFAKINHHPVGVVANQRRQIKTGKGEVEVGGVLYAESADKAARFVMDCNQMKIPIIFLQDVVGFMVGKAAEESGIIKSGAKLVNAVSNSIVPKITIVIGNSFGAGNYAMCGKAYDPTFILAWSNAKFAVMGSEQAADTLFHIQKNAAEKKGHPWNESEAQAHREQIIEQYKKQTDIRYGAARGWVDSIIPPHHTREYLIKILEVIKIDHSEHSHFHTGVLQV